MSAPTVTLPKFRHLTWGDDRMSARYKILKIEMCFFLLILGVSLSGCTEHTPPTGGGTGDSQVYEIRI